MAGSLIDVKVDVGEPKITPWEHPGPLALTKQLFFVKEEIE